MKKKIIFFSGNRAEYSFQKYIIKKIKNKFDIDFIVSGSHLKNEFGEFFNQIKKDKIHITKKIDIRNSTNNISNFNNYILDLNKGLINYIKGKKFDFAFVFSDRFETFIFAYICFLNQIPIIHYEGGDITDGGTFDDKIRYSISQISDYHLVTNKFSLNNLKKIGINKKNIIDIGLLSLHEDLRLNEKKFIQFRKNFDLTKKDKFILFTYHSIPKLKFKNIKNIDECILALKEMSKNGWKIIITYPNFDPFYDVIIKKLKKINDHKNIILIKNLGTAHYHCLLEFAGKNKNGLCVGNSSSGIKEANYFLCPTINIGLRQKGRLRSSSVFDVVENKKKIIRLIKKVRIIQLKNQIKFEKNLYFKKDPFIKIQKLLNAKKI